MILLLLCLCGRLLLLVVLGNGQKDHRQFFLVDLPVLVVVDSAQDRFLEIEKILSVVILKQKKSIRGSFTSQY